MQGHRSPSFRARQRGAALLVFILLAFLAATSWVLAQSSGASVHQQAARRTADALAQAKQALIGRAARDDNRPGSLSCPDTDNDGVTNGNFGVCDTFVGRLPWKTLDLPELLDGNGEHLWYALSMGLSDNEAAQPINPQKALELRLDGTPNIAAIIFSPGAPLAGQDGRSSDAVAVAVADYLDGSNNDGDTAFVSGPQSATFNDTLLAITRDELFRTVNQRVLAEIRGPDDNAPGAPNTGLRHYHAVVGTFPWADGGNEGIAEYGTVSGRLPYAEAVLGLPAWLTPNGWPPLIAYERTSPDAVRIVIGTKHLDIVPCPASPCP